MTARKIVVSAALILAASLSPNANSATVALNFVGPGVSGNIQLTYGPATDLKYPQAFEITGITGVFSDSNNGLNIVNALVGPLEPITRDTPEPTNLLAPNDFSRFAVAAGLPPDNNGFLTFDNLYYPGGSPQTASDYPLHGGFFDIYGLMFDIGGGRVVDFWSNGTISGSGNGPIYGVAVATHATALDNVGGVTVTPEPNTLTLLGGGVVAFLVSKKRRFGHKRFL
jgi:PEP-CTERM motif